MMICYDNEYSMIINTVYNKPYKELFCFLWVTMIALAACLFLVWHVSRF